MFLRADRIRPDYWKTQYNLALIAVEQNEMSDAIAYLDRTIELSPKYRAAQELLSKLNNTGTKGGVNAM